MNRVSGLMLVGGILLPLLLLGQVQNWAYRYGGSANGSDEAGCVICGADGNVYAAGYGTFSGSNQDFLVISLSPAGDTNWIFRYGYQGNGGDRAAAVACGPDSAVYAAGSSYQSSTSSDIFVVRFNAGGDTSWGYRYDGTGNGDDAANSLACGSDGRVYVCGSSAGSGTNQDLIVLCISPLGDTDWTYRYDGPGSGNDCANSLCCGADGNVYVCGSCWDSGASDDFLVISLSPAGDTNWVRRYDGPGHDDDCARAIACGADGNIYAAGYSYASFNDKNFTVACLSPAGDINWVYRYNEPLLQNYDEACAVACTSDSGVYACGHCFSNSSSADFLVVSLTPAGDTNWTYCYNGPGNNDDFAYSLAGGADGNIYAAGASYDSIHGQDMILVSLNDTGDSNWTYRYDGPGSDLDRASSLSLGADGGVYIAGTSWGGGTGLDFTVVSVGPGQAVKERGHLVREDDGLPSIFRGSLRQLENRGFRIFDVTGRAIDPGPVPGGIYFIQAGGKACHKIIVIK